MKQRANYTSQYVILGILFVLVFGIQTRLSVGLLRELFSPESVAGHVLGAEEGTDKVEWTSDSARQAGLLPGDRIISVNDRPFTGQGPMAVEFSQAGPGAPVKVNFERKGEVRPAMIVVPAGNQLPWTRKLVTLIYRFLTPMFCLALGFFVAFQRPFDRLAWILLALMASFGLISGGSGLLFYAMSWDDWMRPLAVLVSWIGLTSWPISMMWFGAYFPERSKIDRKWPWAKWLLLAPVVAWGALRVLVNTLSVEHWTAAASLAPAASALDRWVFIFFSLPISLAFVQLGQKSGTLPTMDGRRRLKLIWIGAAISLTPLFITSFIGFIAGKEFDQLPGWVVIPTVLLQFLFPTTLAYVIVVQRAMDVRMALRQGLKYTLARGGVMVLRVLIVVGVVLFTVNESISNQLTGPKLAIAVAVSAAVITLLRGVTKRLSMWVDKLFFREAYNSEQILADLSEQVRTMVETKPLLETVAGRISDSLHVPKVSLVLKDSDGYRPAHSHGFAKPPAVVFADGSATIERLKADHSPLMVYFDDPESWTNTLTSSESDQLSRLETELVLPLAVKDKLHGFIALGQKQSEEPYSSTDVRLLQSVAAQTGLALENSHLTAAIASEVAQRERLNRELEIAREVQQRLFPQKHPAVPGIEYAGYCRPAQGVGGDYYDFVEVPGGYFGIAIGDVSGKGIPAALLMASLQASLRGQAINGSSDLAGLMTNMNRLIFDTSPSNRYATFFYGQYDPRSRVLSYVNAGHNAPMVLRRSEVSRLEDGGPVVGLFGTAKYCQGTVQLEVGDVFVGFTDGISEAMNAADDEFGEEQIVPVVEQARELPSQLIIDRMFAAADAFAAGAPQHDDMTAVVVRVVTR